MASRLQKVGRHATRLLKFGLVGASGLVVNSFVLFVATGMVGIHYLAGAAIATQASTVSNFVLSDRWVFLGTGAARSGWKRFGLFWLMNNIALVARWPILYVLVSVIGINYLISNIISLLVIMLVRYTLSYSVIWRPEESRSDYQHPSSIADPQ